MSSPPTGTQSRDGAARDRVVDKRLRERGDQVFAVNPNAHEVEGEGASPSAASNRRPASRRCW